ncbi:MAG: PDZ domain-containing protein [Phycisphaerae bacterium]|nr:PDZ domain-containing protein [Phycisphaerae bacterium]
MMRTGWGAWTMGIAAVSLGAGSVPAGAEPDLSALVARLGSEGFLDREAASEELGQLLGVGLKEIETQLARRDLSAEQRERLSVVAWSRFVSSARGAVGVEFDRQLPRWYVVQRTIERFPAAKALEAGDIIVEIDGHALAGQYANDLRPRIISRDPGDTVRMVVLRGDQRLTLDVTLGSFGDLDQAMFGEDDLVTAWLARREPYAAHAAAADRLVAPKDALTAVGEGDADPIQAGRRNLLKPRIAAGGLIRDGWVDAGFRPMARGGGRGPGAAGAMIGRNGGVRRGAIGAQAPVPVPPDPEAIREELATITQREQRLRGELEAARNHDGPERELLVANLARSLKVSEKVRRALAAQQASVPSGGTP